jgi:prepilin-type N-terminal cleavage/methylation domain-containing protein
MLLHIFMRAKPSLHHRRGFTLTEIAIVLGVMGMILGAIWGAASTVYSNKKTTAALQEILAIVANMRGLYTNGQIAGGWQPLRQCRAGSKQYDRFLCGNAVGRYMGRHSRLYFHSVEYTDHYRYSTWLVSERRAEQVRFRYYSPHKCRMRGLRDAVDPAGGAERFYLLLFGYDRKPPNPAQYLADVSAELCRASLP